jgi:putative glutamine amidotransferase
LTTIFPLIIRGYDLFPEDIMLVFIVPFNAQHIDNPFIKAFENMRSILSRHNVKLVIIDCRFDNNEHLCKKVESILSWVDGVIFPGNPYSIDPRLYGEPPLDPRRVDPEPKNFEFVQHMIEKAGLKGVPILGICAGSWYLNVVRGGTLHQDVTHFTSPDEIHDFDPRDGRVAHDIRILPNTVLFGSNHARVNSWHDQSINKLGHGLHVSAISPDGLIEAIEDDGDDFFLGIQFHPEYLLSGDTSDRFLPVSEIIKQQNVFRHMANVAHQRANEMQIENQPFKVKEHAVTFHEGNTEKLLNQIEHRGRLKLR